MPTISFADYCLALARRPTALLDEATIRFAVHDPNFPGPPSALPPPVAAVILSRYTRFEITVNSELRP